MLPLSLRRKRNLLAGRAADLRSIGLAIALALAAAPQSATAVAGTEKTFHFQSGGYLIEVATAQVPNRVLGHPELAGWGQDWYNKLSVQVIRISGTWRGRKMEVPLSAYTDLFAPTSARLESRSGSWHLLLVGGDAGGAYRADLMLAKQRVDCRTVRSGEFPRELWERTNYHYIPDDGR